MASVLVEATMAAAEKERMILKHVIYLLAVAAAAQRKKKKKEKNSIRERERECYQK